MSKRQQQSTDWFYHTKPWKEVRRMVLSRDHYCCQECKREGLVTYATTVHHIVPLKEDWSKRLNMDNLEVICAKHHNQEHTEKGANDKQGKRKLQEIKGLKNVYVFKANKDMRF